MTSELKVHVTALAIMATVGVAAPAAAWFATDWKTLPLELRDTMGTYARIDLPTVIAPVETDQATRGTITLREVTITSPTAGGAARHLGHVERPREEICYWHRNEMGSGRVRICDVLRSRTGEVKRLQPGDRSDLPSPTGLLRR